MQHHAMSVPTDPPRRLFAKQVHAEASVIAELNNLRRYARRCGTVDEITAEITERVTAKARRLGLAPDVLGDVIDAALDDSIDVSAPLEIMDEVRDVMGVRGVIVAVSADAYSVAYDGANGTTTMRRTRDQLTLISRAERAAQAPAIVDDGQGAPVTDPSEDVLALANELRKAHTIVREMTGVLLDWQRSRVAVRLRPILRDSLGMTRACERETLLSRFGGAA